MKTIALFANLDKKNAFSIAQEITTFLSGLGVTLYARDEEATHLKIPSLSSVAPEKIDFLISLGGDGTILRLVHQFPHLHAPILGINLGHLGFMADIPLSDLYPSLRDLLEGRYKIETRLMLEGVTPKGERCFALNDIVVHRAKNPSLVDLSIYVDGTYFNTFSADGVIIATPNGSTAYSLAAGGPILSPELEAVIITPISPHTISNRPIVLLPKKEIKIEYLSRFNPIDVIADGLSCYSLASREIFQIEISQRRLKIVSLESRDHFSTLRTKLGWLGQIRYQNIDS